MSTRNKNNRSGKGGSGPADKKPKKSSAGKQTDKRIAAARKPAATAPSAAPASGAAVHRSYFAHAGLDALRERLRQPPAPKKPGGKARREAAKIDARVEAALQRLSEHCKRLLD